MVGLNLWPSESLPSLPAKQPGSLKKRQDFADWALMESYTHLHQHGQPHPHLTIFTVSTPEPQRTEADVRVGSDGCTGSSVDAGGSVTDPAAAFP